MIFLIALGLVAVVGIGLAVGIAIVMPAPRRYTSPVSPIFLKRTESNEIVAWSPRGLS